jgi:hypothetical protein
MSKAMRSSITVLLLALAVLAASATAEELSIERLNVLTGEWRGAGDGKWGHSVSERSYTMVFDGTYLQGSGQSAYPKQDKNPAGEIHKSIDIYSFDNSRQTVALRQFDNEGFVTTYYLNLLTLSPARMEFIAEHLENVPPGWGARIIMEFSGEDEFTEYFELDTNKGSFQRYLTNRFSRVPGPSPVTQ